MKSGCSVADLPKAPERLRASSKTSVVVSTFVRLRTGELSSD